MLFYNRGLTYANLQLLTQAINDFDNSLKIKFNFDPDYGDRKMAFYDLDQKDKAWDKIFGSFSINSRNLLLIL